MSDAELREAERRYLADPTLENSAALQKLRQRAGGGKVRARTMSASWSPDPDNLKDFGTVVMDSIAQVLEERVLDDLKREKNRRQHAARKRRKRQKRAKKRSRARNR